MAEVQRQNATWFASDLMWEIQAALPPLHQDTDSTALMEQCLREAIGNEVEGAEVAWLGKPPDVTDVSVLGVRASDGQSVFRKPQTDKYCTPGPPRHREVPAARCGAARAAEDDRGRGV